jgi:succinate dehydrogenase / fumarate reductase flavoprotein subunit
MRIFPAVHYTMGGAWVDWPAAGDPDRYERYRQMTNIPGCFNVGESDYQYHGANRLGANSLLSCIFGGLVTGGEVPRYINAHIKGKESVPERCYEEALAIVAEAKKEMLSRSGPENVHMLHNELAEWMVANVTVKRNNVDLQRTLNKIREIRERYERITLDDHSQFANQTLAFALQFGPMLDIAQIITKGALLRNEFRGSHYKPEFPKRDDEHWLKTTIATFDPATGDPIITYEPVDMRHLKPIMRDYTKAVKVKPTLENLPKNFEMPI